MNREILNIVNRVLSEEISGRIKNVRHKIFETDSMKGECCSECGSTRMVEGECYECGYGAAEMGEELKGNQYKIDKNKNNKIDREDFKMLRSKRELDELGGMEDEHPRKYGRLPKRMTDDEIERLLRGDEEDYEGQNAALDYEDRAMRRYFSKDREDGDPFDDEYDYKDTYWGDEENEFDDDILDEDDCVECGRKEATYELNMNESTGERLYFAESEMVDMIETIILEEKKKSKTKSKTKSKNPIKLTKSNQEKSKKENDDNISMVVKKMKDYLKNGSKGEYEMNPKHFPKGNGELAKMDKMAYVPSDAVGEYIANFTAASLENLDYDEIHPDDKWVTDNIVGSTRTGNNPEWGNAVETPNNKQRNIIRKDNLLAKLKRKAYNKSPQPVTNDSTGNDKASKLMLKLESTENKKVISEIEKMKNMFDYSKKTQ